MKSMRIFLVSMLAICLFSAAFAQAGMSPLSYRKGDKIQDFTFTTYDGEVHSLYDILSEKEAVLINIWATWCGPCRNEFPFLQEAYVEYEDQVEVIALSCETTDTPSKLGDFANQYGLTFKIGQDPVGFLSALGKSSIPTTLMVDRFGTICFIEAGAQPDADSFKQLFEAFLGEEYTESILLDGIPSQKPNVNASCEEELMKALGASAKNPTNAYTWPMIVTEKDGRMVVASTNAKIPSTRAEVTAVVDANAGDAIVVTFKTSTEPVFDLMNISVNGKTVKSFGGKHEWMTYAIPVDTDGANTVKISYVKDVVADGGEDMVWIDSIALADNAPAALAANPQYPVAEENAVIVTNPEAREVNISDPNGLLAANFGEARYFVVNGDTASVKAFLTAETDPEKAFLYFSFDSSQLSLAQVISENGYTASTNVDSMDTTKYLCSYAILYLDATGNEHVISILFKDEENLNSFVQHNSLGEWKYIENAASDSEPNKVSIVNNGMSSYKLKCIDQDGKPVVGVMLQVCDEETCQVLVSDTNGICEFVAAPYAWEVHILKAPDGYSADITEVVLAPVEGGEMVFTLTSN